MRVHLGSDHAGLELKDHLMTWLADHDYEVVDHGPFVYDADDDYPVFCLRAAEAVAAERAEGFDSLGVVIGGSGNGEQIAANKVPGVRAALCVDAQTARGARKWNDANVLALSLRLTSEEVAKEILEAWLGESYAGTEDESLAVLSRLDAEGRRT